MKRVRFAFLITCFVCLLLLSCSSGDKDNLLFTYSEELEGYVVTGVKNPTNKIVVPRKVDGIDVVAIGQRAFCKYDPNIDEEQYDDVIEIVKLPRTIRVIEAGAFDSCYNLKSVNIPAGVTRIEDITFTGCRSLEKIVIPDGVNYIGYCAFAGCKNLKSVELPDSIEKIAYRAFNGCESLTSVKMPCNILTISGKTFMDCTQLKYIELPKNLIRIEEKAFANCISLESIKIPGTVVELEIKAFDGCTTLSKVSLPRSLNIVGDSAFGNTYRKISFEYPSTKEAFDKIEMQGIWCERFVVNCTDGIVNDITGIYGTWAIDMNRKAEEDLAGYGIYDDDPRYSYYKATLMQEYEAGKDVLELTFESGGNLVIKWSGRTVPSKYKIKDRVLTLYNTETNSSFIAGSFNTDFTELYIADFEGFVFVKQ